MFGAKAEIEKYPWTMGAWLAYNTEAAIYAAFIIGADRRGSDLEIRGLPVSRAYGVDVRTGARFEQPWGLPHIDPELV